MKDLLKRMLIPQDKANHFVWTVVILVLVLGTVVLLDTVLDMNLNFFFVIGFSFVMTAIIGLLKEMRDYISGQGTPSFMDTLTNLCGLIAAFILIELAMIAYR